MKTTIKKPAVKKVKVEKSTLKKAVFEKDDKKTEDIIIPVTQSIKDIKKEDLGLSYSSENDLVTEKSKEEVSTVVSETAEERREREAEEFLKATEELSSISEVEKKDNNSYIVIIGIILSVLVIFGIYKIFFSPQKTNNIVDSEVNQQVAVPVPEVIMPVEKITIADPVITTENKKETIATITNPKTLKESSAFKSFTYDASIGKQIVLSGTCHDKYYAFLIFDSKIDYRKDPGMAQSNKAFACPTSGRFTVDINLKDINLQSGSYYIFIADQGATGSWYNPR